MEEDIINYMIKQFNNLFNLSPYEECIFKKLHYGFKPSNKEKLRYIYIYEFKYKTLRLVWRFVDK